MKINPEVQADHSVHAGNVKSNPKKFSKYTYSGLGIDIDLIVGKDLAARLLKTMPSNIEAISVDDLREIYDNAQEKIRHIEHLRENFSQVRTLITALATFAAATFFYIILTYVFEEAQTPSGSRSLFAVSLMMYCGMLGGGISALGRLYSLKWNEEFLIEAKSRKRMFFDFLLNFLQSLLVGAVFSIILYFIFVGGFVQGAVFPVFRSQDDPMFHSLGLFHEYLERGPKSHGEYAKVLVWAFIAGFSERLVPDFISTLSPKLKLSAETPS